MSVRVIRDRTGAVIAHDCEPIVTVRLELGAHARTFSDVEIVDCYSRKLGALGATLAGSPQLRWDEVERRWVPRNRVVRCSVEASVDGAIVLIDEVELTLAELGSMLARHGAQVCLVFLDD
jgi:hypothetical protein